MKIIIPTTSTKFYDLMTEEQKKELKQDYEDTPVINILNNGTSDIYFENGEEATIDKGFPIKPGVSITTYYKNIHRLNIIGEADGEIRLINL